MREIPALPAGNVGTRARVVRPCRIGFFAGNILHDCRRLPQLEVAIDQSRRARSRVDGDKSRRLRATFSEIDELEFERHTEITGERANLPGVWRGREAVEFHDQLLFG